MQEGVEAALGAPVSRFDIALDAPAMTARALFIYGDNDVIVPASAGQRPARDGRARSLSSSPASATAEYCGTPACGTMSCNSLRPFAPRRR